MRILFVTQDFPPPFRGGSYVLFHSLYRLWPHDELRVMAASPSADAPPLPPGELGGDDPRRISRPYIMPSAQIASWREKAEMLWTWAWDGLRVMRAEHIEMVHGGQLFPVGLVAWFLSLVARRPFIQWIVGEDIAILDRLRGPHRLRVWASDFVLRQADHLVTISQPTADLLMARGVPRERITIIRPGFDAASFAAGANGAQIRTSLGLGDRRVLLTVGRLTQRKGHDMVLRALPAIIAKVPDLIYLVAGLPAKGELIPLTEMAAEAGVSDHLRLLGPVTAEQLPSLYAAADLFIMPNRTLPSGDTEGFGIVFLEANALGRPVIGGRDGGAADAIAHGESGLLVDGHDPAAIAEAAIRLLTDRDLARRLGEGGLARLATWPQWEESAAALYALSRRLCER